MGTAPLVLCQVTCFIEAAERAKCARAKKTGHDYKSSILNSIDLKTIR